MNKKEAYYKKIAAELELAEAKLATWKAKAGVMAADIRIGYVRQVDELEAYSTSLKAQLKELADAGEHAWEKLQTGINHTVSAVQKSIHTTAAKFN